MPGSSISQKILARDPKTLADYAHRNEEGEGGAQEQSTALPMTKSIAALREAQGLSKSYAPSGAEQEVTGMAASATYNLKIEAAQGLSPNISPGGAGFSSSGSGEAKKNGD